MKTQTNTQTNMKPLVLIRDKNEIFYQTLKKFPARCRTRIYDGEYRS